MRERSALFVRLRLMIARFLARNGDVPPFGGSAGAHPRVRVPPRGGGPPRRSAMALAEADEEPELAGAIGSYRRP
jgi:hypothetical protein